MAPTTRRRGSAKALQCADSEDTDEGQRQQKFRESDLPWKDGLRKRRFGVRQLRQDGAAAARQVWILQDVDRGCEEGVRRTGELDIAQGTDVAFRRQEWTGRGRRYGGGADSERGDTGQEEIQEWVNR